MLQTFSPDKRSKLTLRIFLVIIIIIGQVVLNSTESYCQPHDLPEGVAISINTPNGNKGLILPKVELTDLSKYSPIRGNPIDGLLVENTHVDASNDLVRGIYIWNENRWHKLLSDSDIPPSARGTKVFTGPEDPNQSPSHEVTNAPIGSLYINTSDNMILKKVAATGQYPSRWENILSLETGKYVGSTSIKIKANNTESVLEAIVGPGLKITGAGISAAVDSSTININQRGLTAQNNEPLWNANKIQNTELEIRTPAPGDILKYNGSKWSNAPNRVYTGVNGISVTGDTIRALIDTVTLKITNNQIGAQNEKAIWNAEKLYNSGLSIGTPDEGQILRYDGSKFLSQSELVYTSGNAINVVDNKISALIDTAKLLILDNNQISAKNEEAIWNANQLLGKPLHIEEPKANDYLKYDGTKWINMPESILTGGDGIEIPYEDTAIKALLDANTLMPDSISRQMQAKNEEHIWNSSKLQGVEIQSAPRPSDKQILKYDSKDNKWAFKNLGLPPDGISPGEILTWIGNKWQPQSNQKFLVQMRAEKLYLPGFSIKDTVIVDHPQTNSLLVGSKLITNPNTTYIQKWDGVPWSTFGNKNMPDGDHILGFVTQDKPGVNKKIIFKTKGEERMRIDSEGKIDIKSNDVRFLDFSDASTQEIKDHILMVDKNKKLKLWSGRAWSNTGEDLITNENYILGFNKEIDTKDTGGIDFITSDAQRIQIRHSNIATDDNTFILNSSNISFTDLPINDAQGELSILMLDKDYVLTKSNEKISNESFFVHNKELRNGGSTLGFINSSAATDLVFRTQNTDRLRIEDTGAIKMQLSNLASNNYDLVVIDRNNGKLSKINLKSVLSNTKVRHTDNKTNVSNRMESKTKVISIADISSKLTDMDIDIDATELDGVTTINILYTDNKPEIATQRYGTALLEIGYDNTGNLPSILTYAYEMTNNNKNILKSSLQTDSVNIDGIKVSFNLKKTGDIYKIVPNINKGNKTKGYLTLQTKIVRTATTSIKVK